MNLRRRLNYLLPAYRRAEERDMQEELNALAEMAEPGELGNLTRVAEEGRAAWNWTWLEQLYRDAQYAFRTLRRNPAFTATAVLSLALGIGANTAIFSLVDALMLRWLPVRDPQALVQVKMGTSKSEFAGDTFSYAIVNALAEERTLFEGVCGFSGTEFTIGPVGSLSRVPGAWVTGAYYETLGLNPELGRLLTRTDDQPGAAPAAVISDGYWSRQYARSPGVIGQTIPMNGKAVPIVGVSPAGFTGANVGSPADITIAVAALPSLQPVDEPLLGRGNYWLRVLARPRPGLSVQQATAHLAVVWPQIAEREVSPAWPAAQRKELKETLLLLVPGGTGYTFLRAIFQKPLMVLMGVTGLVLLIACANVASLLLARATARRREISVRLAIGAGRGRIIRQLLTESTLLASIGAAFGIGVAWVTARFLLGTLSAGGHFRGRQVQFDLTPNWRVLAFTSAVALATGILFGLAPALQATALGGANTLQEDARGARSRSRLLSSLVSLQVALSLMLLIGAGLFARTLQNLQNVDPGFRREGVLLVDVDGRSEGYKDERLLALYKDLPERVRRLPGVASASIASHTPLSGSTWSEAAVPKGQVLPEKDNAIFVAAGPRFFSTMQTRLVAGREFTERDDGEVRVAIVNEAYAARHFPGRNPIGEHLMATVAKPARDLEIVGVVANVAAGALRRASHPTVYVPFFQQPPRSAALEIRASGSLAQVAEALRKELQPAFPSSPLEVRALSEQVEQTLVQERLMASLAGGFGVLGLLLACAGLYGLLAYSVARRTKEIGIRVALGARPQGVQWMVARGALRLIGIGVLLGLPAAWAASRWVGSMLFGLSTTDPKTIMVSVVLLAAAGLLAAYLPAQRAARVEPMTALRHE
ncbi:ABC transporter permease [Paludibaculum fermentans]|uniref:ABC transporter permease n=1 Tax=Paludibaculum fermentans TaxID=1473598 RepID=A0A7S7NNZ0_PALFE|nr:ABC transporter permease [Paludibaculum fermentans]QOY86594.1 ABC transporter permease [Paludibaculum fermentans]